MSHTTKVKVEYLDMDALRRAVEAVGGEWMGFGKWGLFSSVEQGTAWKLPGWAYPCVLADDGTLRFDNYNESWGKSSMLETLQAEYALQVATAAATAQGWYCERGDGVVTIYHPDGGTITVDAAGAVDASRFIGQDCVTACAPIEAALGSRSERTLKAEAYQAKQVIRNGEGGE